MNINEMEDLVWNVTTCREACKQLLCAAGFTPNMKDYELLLNIAKLAYAVGVRNVVDGTHKVGETPSE